MILNSDLMLYHPLWERADDELCAKDGLGIFNRLIDVFVLACAIGIREDKIVTEIEEKDVSPKKTIGRNTYSSLNNTNLRDLLDFMLQNALLNSSTIYFNIDERLKLAFDPDYTIPKFSATAFLIGFANYGIEQIFEHVNSKSPLVVLDELHTYFESFAGVDVEELLKNFTLEEIIKSGIEEE